MKNTFLLFFCLLAIGSSVAAQSQDASGIAQPAGAAVSEKMVSRIGDKYAGMNQHLQDYSVKSLKRFRKLEERLRKKLAVKDSLAAQQLFAGSKEKYDRLLNKVSEKGGKLKNSLKDYVPGLDSTKTTLSFLSSTNMPGIQSISTGAVSSQITAVQYQLQSAGDIKQFIKERQQQLKEQLNKLGLTKKLQQFNKQAYYYQQQVSEYKAMLNDPDKMEQKALGIVRNMPAFKDFMAKNSMLAQLFPPSSGGGSAQALQGLQTRAGIQQQLAQQLAGSGGANPQAYLQNQVQAAQAQMNKLKEKINKAGGGSSDLEMPDFKPNSQKTKSFLKRIEYGLNLQSQKPNGWMPVTTDVALTAGYKLNDKSTIGIGAGYKIGWGKDISHIRITSQGLSLRSFIDMKVKGSFWITGGYEANYQQEFTKIDQLKNINAWQRSGLIGVTKKYKLGKKNGNMQLLWDFLSYSQTPQTTPLKFRVGYTL